MDNMETPEGNLSQRDISSLIESAAQGKSDVPETETADETVSASPAEKPPESKPAATRDDGDPPSVSAGNVAGRDPSDDRYSVNIQRVLDISIPVTVSFGSTSRTLNEILKMAPGTLLELNRSAEDPVVLKANGKPFAWGRVVDVDGYYGVEITEILTQADRIVSLGETQ